MPFPPNYRQDRNNRARTKAQKALEKQARREAKSSQRHERDDQNQNQPAADTGEPRETRE
jgi:hypothetical protein